jgi:hypothetical protein
MTQANEQPKHTHGLRSEKHRSSRDFFSMLHEMAMLGRRLSVRKLPKVWWSDNRTFPSNPKPRKVTRQLRKQADKAIAELRASNIGKPQHAKVCIKPKHVRWMLRHNITAI